MREDIAEKLKNLNIEEEDNKYYQSKYIKRFVGKFCECSKSTERYLLNCKKFLNRIKKFYEETNESFRFGSELKFLDLDSNEMKIMNDIDLICEKLKAQTDIRDPVVDRKKFIETVRVQSVTAQHLTLIKPITDVSDEEILDTREFENATMYDLFLLIQKEIRDNIKINIMLSFEKEISQCYKFELEKSKNMNKMLELYESLLERLVDREKGMTNELKIHDDMILLFNDLVTINKSLESLKLEFENLFYATKQISKHKIPTTSVNECRILNKNVSLGDNIKGIWDQFRLDISMNEDPLITMNQKETENASELIKKLIDSMENAGNLFKRIKTTWYEIRDESIKTEAGKVNLMENRKYLIVENHQTDMDLTYFKMDEYRHKLERALEEIKRCI